LMSLRISALSSGVIPVTVLHIKWAVISDHLPHLRFINTVFCSAVIAVSSFVNTPQSSQTVKNICCIRNSAIQFIHCRHLSSVSSGSVHHGMPTSTISRIFCSGYPHESPHQESKSQCIRTYTYSF